MNKLFSLALITACMFVSIESSAGADGGPKYSRDTVRAYSKDHYITTFKGKELAQVSVVGDHSTDLDCQVFDNTGHLVDQDMDSSDICVLSWTPAWTGKFKITIINNGNQANEYYVQTN